MLRLQTLEEEAWLTSLPNLIAWSSSRSFAASLHDKLRSCQQGKKDQIIGKRTTASHDLKLFKVPLLCDTFHLRSLVSYFAIPC